METKTFNVCVTCKAYYNASIEVPKNMTFEEALEYTREHLDSLEIDDLEYIGEDELDEDNCEFDEYDDDDNDDEYEEEEE